MKEEQKTTNVQRIDRDDIHVLIERSTNQNGETKITGMSFSSSVMKEIAKVYSEDNSMELDDISLPNVVKAAVANDEDAIIAECTKVNNIFKQVNFKNEKQEIVKHVNVLIEQNPEVFVKKVRI